MSHRLGRGRLIRSGLLFAILSAVLILPSAWAAQPYHPRRTDPILASWRWHTYSELEGVGVRCLTRGNDGAIWFGVTDGVVRYDGVQWTTYTPEDGLLGAPVYALLATRSGSLYAGSELGISRFQAGQWARIFPPDDSIEWQINDLIEASDGSLWAGTAWGAIHVTKTKVIR